MTNNNGLLIDAKGVIRGIELAISNEPVTGFKRIARHERLVIGANLQMTQQVRIIRVDSEGVELTQKITDQALSGNVQSQLLNAYQDSLFSANTEGSLVDAYGNTVEKNGIEELKHFQSITLGALAEQGLPTSEGTSLPMLVYILLKVQIQKLDAQGRL